LGKSFYIHHLKRSIPAVRGIGFEVRAGEFLGIVGKSGSGKSTVLKSIYRTYLPEAGQILYDSAAFGTLDLVRADMRKMIYLRKNEIGYVSQFLNILPRRSALELVEKALWEMNAEGEEANRIAKETLRHFGLPEALWDNYPLNFSGGEKVRLNIARAVVKRPRLLLLDEPTASLDDASKYKVREAIEKLKQNGTTMIGIFHDLVFMEGLCDRIYDMERAEESVPPDAQPFAHARSS
jgi:alpha-D-ribose 1-methylphosphonate 5-triphosphate synthase subunit PhnL